MGVKKILSAVSALIFGADRTLMTVVIPACTVGEVTIARKRWYGNGTDYDIFENGQPVAVLSICGVNCTKKNDRLYYADVEVTVSMIESDNGTVQYWGKYSGRGNPVKVPEKAKEYHNFMPIELVRLAGHWLLAAKRKMVADTATNQIASAIKDILMTGRPAAVTFFVEQPTTDTPASAT